MTHMRRIVRISLLIIIALAIICGITIYFFKPTYSVSLNGEFLGYTQNKSELQSRINEALQKGNGGTLAFVQIDNMPEYSLCMLKRNVETNDDEIYQEVKETGTKYYRYYAISDDNDEKIYLASFDEADDAIKELKEKESTNASDLTIVEKYETELPELNDTDEAVDELYQEKKATKTKTTT